MPALSRLALIVLCGCQLTPPDGVFRCTSDQDCPPGMRCAETYLCYRMLEPHDGGVGDAMWDAPSDGAEDASACVDDEPCDTGRACELGRMQCVDGVGTCVAVAVEAEGVVCREATSECDLAETCDGLSAVCPADAFEPVGTECSAGYCNAGECGTCAEGELCDTGNSCETGRVECVEGAPTCVSSTLRDAGFVCRASTGACDPAEACDGASARCPGDERLAAGTECRSAAGECDAIEVCDGVSPTCPPDGLLEGEVCRPNAGPCDVPEMCGASVSCPPDEVRSTGTVCRPASTCDVAETCDGASVTCPDDVFAPAGTACPGTGTICDGAGVCADLGCGEACNTGNPCEIGIIDCGGGGPTCVRDRFRPSSHVCRASTGACDVAETCTGSSPACPADGYAASGQVCRAASGACDAAEACTGSSPGCPPDAVAAAGVQCRASAGVCDVAEACNGSSKSCPADGFAAASTVCHPSAGGCDVSETCTGSSATCPSDALRPPGYECRPAIGQCDYAEACDGASPACPSDDIVANGTTCTNPLLPLWRCLLFECNNGYCSQSAEQCPGADVCCEDGCGHPSECF